MLNCYSLYYIKIVLADYNLMGVFWFCVVASHIKRIFFVVAFFCFWKTGQLELSKQNYVFINWKVSGLISSSSSLQVTVSLHRNTLYAEGQNSGSDM